MSSGEEAPRAEKVERPERDEEQEKKDISKYNHTRFSALINLWYLNLR
jgi:hypothetical protein